MKSVSIFLITITLVTITLFGLATWYDAERAQALPYTTDHHFVIVVCSYNNKNIYQKNLDSIFSQDYHNYHVVYVDDNSPDGTHDAVQKYIQHNNVQDSITLIHNPVNTRQLRNTYYAVHNFSKDDDIIIILDGDDWFAHNQVLSVLNSIYQDRSVWMTCGNYIQDKEYVLVPNYSPPHAYDTRTLRQEYTTPPPHLRSFYSWLFKRIPLKDLLSEGAFIPMAADMAYLFPMLEMAGDHYLPVHQALYIYNTTGALNCYNNKKSQELQQKYSAIIQHKTPYQAIEQPVSEPKQVELEFPNYRLTTPERTQLAKLMHDTDAAIITRATITHSAETKPEHSTYLYDTFWTYQLGFQPQLPYAYQVQEHILNPSQDHNEKLKELITLHPHALPLTDDQLLANQVGILWLQNSAH